jgi:uncharacterized membrane protein
MGGHDRSETKLRGEPPVARYVTAYFMTVIVVAALDSIWLTQVGPTLYKPVIGSLLAPEPRMVPAVLFYVIYIVGVVYFSVAPALKSRRWQTALVNGAVLGFCAYATYDLTNQATLSVWSNRITIMDMAWGTVLSAVGGTGGYLITSAIFRR